jgi:5-methyltetrahydrofolate--homocysteine methyltransferase
MESILREVYESVISGSREGVQSSVQAALDAGFDPKLILDQGLIAAMAEVGRRFEQGEYYVPEMLVAAHAAKIGMSVIKPQLVQSDVPPTGKIVIGTVKGDIHDLGKNLVGMMLEGVGFEVIDLGTDVAPERFAAMARQENAQVLGMSALLTTTMKNMKDVIEALEDTGIRGNLKVMVGGAPITKEFAAEIGANGYAADASQAATLARSWVE